MACTLDLTYRGRLADQNQLQFYDLANALWGFERAISLTTHLLINGEVITQSPSAKGFHLVVMPPEEGSWKISVAIGLGTIIHAFGTAPPDSQFGWLAKSAVEYVIQETLGFSPDFDETLGPQIERYRQQTPHQRIDPDLDASRFDSVIEKCENGLRNVHRPIVFSSTAEVAQIGFRIGPNSGTLNAYFDQGTFEYISETFTSEDIEAFCGVISSYNVNTFKGRIYIPEEGRTIPFELSEEARTLAEIQAITGSLAANALDRDASKVRVKPDVCLHGFRNETSSGRLKRVFVTDVERVPE